MKSLEQISTLQDRIADAQRQRARAEGARAVAQADLDATMDDLRREYQVTDLEAATLLLEQMRAELDQIAADITTTLDEIGVA